MVTKHAGIKYDKYLQKQKVNQKHTLNRFILILCPSVSYPIKITQKLNRGYGF